MWRDGGGPMPGGGGGGGGGGQTATERLAEAAPTGLLGDSSNPRGTPPPPPHPPNPTYNHCTTPSLQPCVGRLKQQPLWAARLHLCPTGFTLVSQFPPPFTTPSPLSPASAASSISQEASPLCSSVCCSCRQSSFFKKTRAP